MWKDRITRLMWLPFCLYDKTYAINGFKIKLSRGHTLPLHQRFFPLYDRFLPYLTLDENSSVFDIGANVGDTAVSLLKSFGGQLICVDPEPRFFELLEQNIAGLEDPFRQRVRTINSFVGTGRLTGILKKHEGTARIDKDDQSRIPYLTLDELIANLPVESVSLIKCDVDGFDYDVLLSGLDAIAQHEPLLYWENQIENQEQWEGYDHLYDELARLGYSHYWVFDNFGNLVLSDATQSAVRSINRYIYSYCGRKLRPTFNYVDILCCPGPRVESVRRDVAEYQKLIARMAGN